MATKKKTTEKVELTKKEKDRFFDLLDKARIFALKMSKNDKKTSEVRRAFASIEKKLVKIKLDYYWGRLTNYR